MRLADVNPLPSLFTIAPANRDHEVGLRCAVTVFVPLLLLLLLNRVDLAVFASFSAFTAIYGRNQPHGLRLRSQLRAGGLMLGVLLLATLLARAEWVDGARPWALVAWTTVVAGVCAVITAYWRLRPAGSLFHIFAFAAVASVPYQPPLGEALLTAVLVVGFAVLVGLSSRVAPSRRAPLTWPEREPMPTGGWKLILLESSWYVIAAGVAGVVATLLGPTLGIDHNYWAMVAAVVPLVGHSTRYRVNRGLQRIIGTFLGLGILTGILWADPPLWALVVLIAGLQFLAEMFIARQYVLAQMVVTPLALLSTVLAAAGAAGAASQGAAAVSGVDRGALIYDRAVETVIGTVVGMVCVMLPWAWRKWVRRTPDPARAPIGA